MAFVFTAKNGCCPECIAFGRRWYIMDRHLYGDTYEYCLMSVSTEPQPVYQFNSRRDLASWLNDIEDYTEKDEWWIDFFIRRWIRQDYADVALIEKNGIQYRYDKEKHTLTALPERRQESCWYEKYRECLAHSKEILRKMQSNSQAISA